MKKFKVGQVVMLRSGGPEMTVSDRDTLDDEHAWCQWFGGRKLEEGKFPVASLVEPTDGDGKKK